MTLLDPPYFSASPFLFAQPASFGSVLAQPERHILPDGDLLVFRFGNGYGAAITHMNALSADCAYEFCVLDCTACESQPTSATPVSSGLLAGLDHATATHLLTQTERLPRHPQLIRADETLIREMF